MRYLIFLVLLLSPFKNSFCDNGKSVYVLKPAESLPTHEITLNEEPTSSTNLPFQKYETSILRVFLSFLGLIALVVLSFWVFRRLSQGRLSPSSTQKSIKVLERKVLSPKSMLYLVEVDGKKVFLAESHLEIKPLYSWKNLSEPDHSEDSLNG